MKFKVSFHIIVACGLTILCGLAVIVCSPMKSKDLATTLSHIETNVSSPELTIDSTIHNARHQETIMERKKTKRIALLA